nr:uncharacterized protein LOC119159806 [Rhipicephalus microplus]
MSRPCPHELTAFLNRSKRRSASGVDKITVQMLRNLAESEKAQLLDYFKDIWNSEQLPKSRLTATIVPILKAPQPQADSIVDVAFQKIERLLRIPQLPEETLQAILMLKQTAVKLLLHAHAKTPHRHSFTLGHHHHPRRRHTARQPASDTRPGRPTFGALPTTTHYATSAANLDTPTAAASTVKWGYTERPHIRFCPRLRKIINCRHFDIGRSAVALPDYVTQLFSEFVNATSFDVPLDEELGRSTQFVSSSQHLEVVSPSGERLLGSYKASLQRSKLVIDSAWCGLGGCAPTQTANPFTLVMQVSKTYSLLAKKSSNYLLFQLPSPHCCVLVALECSRVIRALLMMSGDIESNPGPASNAVLTELQKLSAGQTELISQVQDLKSHLLSTDKSIADLSRRMTDLEGHCQNIISLRTDVEALRSDTARASDLLRKLEARVDEAENHSRRNNLIFYGLPESTGSEALVQVEQLVIKHCRDRLGISIDPKEIERAHRLGRRKGTNHHRPIIVKFAFHKTKGEILSNGRKFKGTTFSVGEDFSRRVQNVRRQLIAFAKTKSLPFSITYKTLLMGHKRYVYDEQSQTVREAS